MSKFIAVSMDYFDQYNEDGPLPTTIFQHEVLTIGTTEEVDYEYTGDTQIDCYTHWSYVVIADTQKIVREYGAWVSWNS
jgi:hypothetical protein